MICDECLADRNDVKELSYIIWIGSTGVVITMSVCEPCKGWLDASRNIQIFDEDDTDG